MKMKWNYYVVWKIKNTSLTKCYKHLIFMFTTSYNVIDPIMLDRWVNVSAKKFNCKKQYLRYSKIKKSNQNMNFRLGPAALLDINLIRHFRVNFNQSIFAFKLNVVHKIMMSSNNVKTSETITETNFFCQGGMYYGSISTMYLVILSLKSLKRITPL